METLERAPEIIVNVYATKVQHQYGTDLYRVLTILDIDVTPV